MIRLTRLKIDKYRQCVPGTELHFDDGINVLLGKNGTGKTTLLNLIAMCARFDLSALAKEEFALEYDLKLETAMAQVRVENRTSGSLANQMGSPSLTEFAFNAGDELRFESNAILRLRFGEPERVMVLKSAPTGVQVELGGIPVASKATRPLQRGVEDAMYLPALFLTMISAAGDKRDEFVRSFKEMFLIFQEVYRFDESLVIFRAMVGRVDEEAPHGISAGFSLTGTPSSGYTSSEMHLVPRAVVKEVSERPSLRDAEGHVFTHEQLDSLREFTRILGLEAATMTVSLLQRHLGPGDVVFLKLGDFKFLFRFKDGSIITHDLLSYGQKRFLAFLYYLDCSRQIVVADELVNGLHHEWIEACLGAIGDRQAFLTSQNPLLLDDLTIDSAERAERCFVQCKADTGDVRWLRWTNMSQPDAAAFYRGYLAGIQHVSELLRTEGLW